MTDTKNEENENESLSSLNKRTTVRMSQSLFESIARYAKLSKMSANAFMIQCIEQGIANQQPKQLKMKTPLASKMGVILDKQESLRVEAVKLLVEMDKEQISESTPVLKPTPDATTAKRKVKKLTDDQLEKIQMTQAEWEDWERAMTNTEFLKVKELLGDSFFPDDTSDTQGADNGLNTPERDSVENDPDFADI